MSHCTLVLVQSLDRLLQNLTKIPTDLLRLPSLKNNLLVHHCVQRCDESRFQLCPDDHRRRVWRRPRQRADAAFAIAYHTGPQPEVMVWCLSHTSLASQISLLWNMIGRRLPLPGNVDDLAQRLEQIWQEIPQETIRGRDIDKFELQMSKASSYTSKSTATYLPKKESETGIMFFLFDKIPVKSPDTSSMEFCAFGLIKPALGKRHTRTLNGLWGTVQDGGSRIGITVQRKSLLS
ncbi:uncharacterized protein TNCV_1886411 [Trichonephila clavipes]|nr:uncharacterized protein TNCV_1886411 [Trichonephila clavipes]